MTRTEEQLELIESMLSNEWTVCNAKSGTGKSNTCVAGLNESNLTSGVILSFNSDIAKDNAKIVPEWCESITLHTLARRYTVKAYNLPTIPNLRANMISKEKSPQATVALIKKFCQSDKLTIDEIDFDDELLQMKQSIYKKDVFESAKRILGDMFNGSRQITFDGYLKLFQILLSRSEVNVSYDIGILDEAADASPLMISIIENIKSKHKVLVGDRYQQINKWNGSIDGIKYISEKYNIKQLELTNTFRCDATIAKPIESFMAKYNESDFKFTGFDKMDEYANIVTPSVAFLSRTNTGLVEMMGDLVRYGVRFSLSRDVNSIFNLMFLVKIGCASQYLDNKNGRFNKFWKEEDNWALNIYEAAMDFAITENKVMPNGRIDFATWILKFANDDNDKYNVHVDQELIGAANFAKSTKGDIKQLIDLKKKVKDMKKNSGVILSTAHSTKGRSFDVVYIHESLNNRVEEDVVIDPRTGEKTFIPPEDEEVMTYYVACTRAKYHVSNAFQMEYHGYDSKLSYQDCIMLAVKNTEANGAASVDFDHCDAIAKMLL